MPADAADLETLNSRDFFGESSLHVASRMGLSEVANKLVERMGPQSIGERSTAGLTPLHVAMHAKEVTLASMLVDMGSPEILRSCDRAGETYHQVATRLKLQEVALKLMKVADSTVLAIPNSAGKTALQVVTENEEYDEEVVAMVVKKADDEILRVRDGTGETCLHNAVRRVLKEVVTMISTRIPDTLGIQNRRGDTPVHLAMYVAAAQEQTRRNKSSSPLTSRTQNVKCQKVCNKAV